MIETDIAIVGGGLAGSTAAAMLGRAGIKAVLIDPHNVYPPDFRCEKITIPHISAMQKTGIADLVLPAMTADASAGDGTTWISRYGRLLDRRPGDQHGIMYEDFVNTVRRAIPDTVMRITAKAVGLTTSDNRQTIALSNGTAISSRLVVLANGLNIGLRHSLGIGREITSPCHSVTIGFDVKPIGRAAFEFGSVTHYTERVSDRMAYLTLFPIGSSMRANLFTYRNADDPLLREIRQNPVPSLHKLMPHLKNVIGEFDVEGPIRVRPIDLYASEGHLQSGIVLVGDAFATSCPAAGTGSYKVFTDVGQLCNIYIPQWLATPGMGRDKIVMFYDDPIKTACDQSSLALAHNLKSLSIDPGFGWMTRRVARFGVRLTQGALRKFRPADTTKKAGTAADHATTARHGRLA